MEQMPCRMVKDQVTQTFLCGRMGYGGGVLLLLHIYAWPNILFPAGTYKVRFKTPRDNGL